MVPKIFETIGARYANRPGGYTRVLRIEPIKEDQAESAILELVDSPKDMRFAMTAKTLASKPESEPLNKITAKNVEKVTRYRENGMESLRDMVQKLRQHNYDVGIPAKKLVYPDAHHNGRLRF